MSEQKIITIAAAIILNSNNQTLLVRKKNTSKFMHVGGKLEANEFPEQALKREVFEEIGCEIEILSFIGQYQNLAANEADHTLLSYVYHVALKGKPQLQAELAELKWVDLTDTTLDLAPLTKEVSIPWCKDFIADKV